MTIPLTDAVGLNIDLQLDEKSDLGASGLKALESKTSEFVKLAAEPLDRTSFHSAVLGAKFTSPAIPLSDALKLTIKDGVNAAITLYRSSDGTLFKDSGDSPLIKIGETQCWICFELDVSLNVAVGATSPSGFGVCGEKIQASIFSSYTLIESADGQFPTLKEGVERALANFRIVRGAFDIRGTKADTVHAWDVAGAFKITGEYGLPLAANALSLAHVKLPLQNKLNILPGCELKLTGSLMVAGEFKGFCYRANDATVQLGLYKKKETDLSAAFAASAGLGAVVGSTDLIGALFSVLPDANFKPADIPEADRKVMETALQNAIDQGFSIAVNACCSAAVSDELAVLYQVDFSSDPSATDGAISAALRGDWTPLAKLSNAKELRNVLGETHKSKHTASLNLLGIYDYASVDEFIRNCTLLHNLEDGSITVTDTETAKRIAVSSIPFRAQDDKLRKVLDEAFLATVSYTAANTNAAFGAKIQAKQALLLYRNRASYTELRKDLLPGVALQLLTASDLENVPLEKQFKYSRVAASATFEGENALRLFFSDTAARLPHREGDLKRLGRQVLASLLDRNIAVDNARWLVLNSDAEWAKMDAQNFPPGSYSDWYDITFWATAIAQVAPRLKAVLDVLDRQSGADLTKDAPFMAARDALAKAIAEVTRNTHAAFEKGWPIAVMFALSERRAPVSFGAQWDGVNHFEKQSGMALAGSG